MIGFSGILDWLGRRSLDDEWKIDRWKGIWGSFIGKLVKMIKDVNGRFGNYSISPKTRKDFIASRLWISWKWFAMIYFFVHIKMSYYWFNR